MCLTANSIRECGGSIFQIVGFSSCGAVVAVIAVPPNGSQSWAGQSGPWCRQARVRLQTVMSGGSALLSVLVLLQRAVPPHSGPGRVLRQAWHVVAVCRTLMLSRALAPRQTGRTVSLSATHYTLS